MLSIFTRRRELSFQPHFRKLIYITATRYFHTCTALLRKQLFSPHGFSNPFVPTIDIFSASRRRWHTSSSSSDIAAIQGKMRVTGTQAAYYWRSSYARHNSISTDTTASCKLESKNWRSIVQHTIIAETQGISIIYFSCD